MTGPQPVRLRFEPTLIAGVWVGPNACKHCRKPYAPGWPYPEAPAEIAGLYCFYLCGSDAS